MVLLMWWGRKDVRSKQQAGDLAIFNKILYCFLVSFCLVFDTCFGFYFFNFVFVFYAFRRCLTAGCVFRLVAEMGGFGLFLLFIFFCQNIS